MRGKETIHHPPFKKLRSAQLALGIGLLLCATLRLDAEISPPPGGASGLTLSNLVQLVLERNETLQSKLLDFEVSRQRHLAEKGVFEPDLVGSFNHEVNNRPNNAEQQNTDQNSVLHETNNIYDGGLESLIPTGAKLHLGYTLSDLHNNIFPSGLFSGGLTSNLNQLQYQTFIGVTVDQPLLKNFGPAVTMAGIRIAALSSKIAFQEYRRQLMTVVSTAEATYWNLYLSQQQEQFFEDSVHTAETILNDNRTRLEAGKGSELEVMEAQAGLGLRRAKLGEAQQKVVEAANRVVSFYAGRADGTNQFLRALDAPTLREEHMDFDFLGSIAFTANPDYVIQEEKVDQELIKLGYARNQRLPQFDLKGAYGYNGLGATPEESWDAAERTHFLSWSIGAEFRIPLGATKVRHEYTAAELQVQSAELALQGLQTEIFNGLDTARHKVLSLRDSVASYQSAVDYNRTLLDSAMTRLQAGKLESRKVLDIEADLFEARNSVVESLVRYQIAWLEMQVLSGGLLRQRNLDISQEDLQRTTRDMLKDRGSSGANFLHGNNEQNAYYPKGVGASPYNDSALRDALHRKESELENPSGK
ncbi:MAG TPA: TolC family protein [Verrucomicrobiae bacterium]|nr:TolC family protein [Verrucomicrobiae bacterium]